MNLIILFSGQGLQKPEHLTEIMATATAEEKRFIESKLPELFLDNVTESFYANITAQPFIYCLQYYRWQQLQPLIDTPIALAGYSLGEACAFCMSGQIDFKQGFEFIQTRARLMQENSHSPSGLLSIQGLQQNQLLLLLEQTQTYLSIKISPELNIIGGFQANLAHASEQAIKLGAQAVNWLKVSVPSHTPLLRQATNQFLNYTQTLPNFTLHLPIISATQGMSYIDSNKALTILSQQIDHALDWYICMETIREYQPDIIIEIGPGNALTRMINGRLPHIPCRSFDDFKNIMGLQTWINKHL